MESMCTNNTYPLCQIGIQSSPCYPTIDVCSMSQSFIINYPLAPYTDDEGEVIEFKVTADPYYISGEPITLGFVNRGRDLFLLTCQLI
jgi:hypothetical protein